MRPDPDDLGDLADAVLEGRPLDWQELESSAGAESRSLISQFRTIARIADIRRRVANDPPEWWGHLKIQERLGAGAFGEVFRAWDSRLEREVALKLLNSDHDPPAVLREARLLARIRHPNIVTVFDAAEFEGRAGFWMEFIQGQTLEEGARDHGPLPAPEVRKLAIELCGALAAVHAAGLLHRDIKAQNVVRTADGRVVLMDFGAGDELSCVEPVSQQSVGTPLYLAPEVLSGGAATPLSEIYSLGVLLFRVATGGYPVHSGTIDELRASHDQGSRKKILDIKPHFPRDLAIAIDRALDPDAGRRFETASAMEAALAAPSADGHLHRTPVGTRRLITVAAGILIATIAVLAWTNRRIPLPLSEPLLEADVIVPQVPPEFPSTVQSTPGDAPAENKSLPATESRVTLQMVNADLQRRFNFRALADDGVHATCTPWGGSAVAICELATGAVQELRRPAAPDERAADAKLSPSGTQVAYQWTDRSGTSLRLMKVDRTEDREVYRPPAGRGFRLIKWFREGRAVLLAVSDGARNGNLLAVTIDGGRTEQVWQFDEPDTGRDLSPDERFIVFSRPAPGQATLDIAIVDTRTREESWLVKNPSDDSQPLWTPDGRAVVFLSERLGPSGLFMLPVHEGRPSGDAVLVRDFGRSSVLPVNFARDGTMFFKMTTHWTDAFRAAVDLEKGVIGAPVRVDTRSIEETASPDWSPDGRRYAYVSGPMGRALTTMARLLVHSADGRPERELPLDKVMRRVSMLRWSPDGRHIAVRMANDVDSGAVVDLVDLDTNASRPLLRGVTSNFEWNADGSALYYGDGRQILRYDIATAMTTTVLNGPYVFDVSPRDGSIAVALPLNGCTVWVLAPSEPVRMSDVRATLRDSCLAVAWSRDGQKLLISTLKGPDPPVDLYVMDAGGGDPIRLIVPTEAIGSLSLGPGNRDLLFSAGNPAPEFWTLRGVGSPAKATTMVPTPAIKIVRPK